MATVAFGAINSDVRNEENTSASKLQENLFGSLTESGSFKFLADLTNLLHGTGYSQTNGIQLFAGNAFQEKTGQREKVSNIKDLPIFAEFEAWIKQHKSGAFSNLTQHNQIGEELAIERQQLLEKLIQQDPQAALEKGISSENYENLPSFITEHLEKRVSAYGDFLVITTDEIDRATKKMSGSRTEREVVIGDARYQAFVYGRRQAMTTKLAIPLQGIVLDNLMAVEESPARPIEANQYEKRQLDLSKLSDSAATAAEVGGEVVYFANESEYDTFVNQQIDWESKIGPTRAKTGASQKSSALNQTAWTTGTKSVLLIRVNFPDRLGEPVDYDNRPFTVARAQSLFNDQINPFYVKNSYGNTAIQVKVTEGVFTMPHAQSFYTQGTNLDQLSLEARAAARNAGYETNNYDFDIIAFSYTDGFNWGGLSVTGGKGSFINGAFYMPEMTHELGHNYGLMHANLWLTDDKTVIGHGENKEYGDCYDIMGFCDYEGSESYLNQNSNSYFNTRYKRLLNWLTDNVNVRMVTKETASDNNEYRIFAQDTSSASNVQTLKIPKDATKNYWIEFRQLQPGNAANGALIRWDYASKEFQETQLLDMNPATPTVGDAPLLVGAPSFTDNESGIRITALRKDSAAGSLDVKVEFDVFTNCTYSVSSSFNDFGRNGGTGNISITTGSGCKWTASSSDAWITFPNGNSGTGSGTISFSVASNFGGARASTISIGGKTISISQFSGTCNYSVSPSTFNVSASGGTLNYSQSTDFPCNNLMPVYTSEPSWVDITTNPITVLPNTGEARTATVKLTASDISGALAQVIITVNQSGLGSNCTYALSSAGTNIPASGGTGSFGVSSANGCAWNATSSDSWISITGASGSGNGSVNFSVAANNGLVRTGTISAGGQTFTITQGNGCSFSLSPSPTNFQETGGSGTVSISSAAGCTWSAASNVGWITFASGNAGNGNGTINFTVAPNAGVMRSGTITIGTQSFTVSQASGCSFSLSSTSANFGDAGGNGSFNVTSGSGCTWTASNNGFAWITINGGASGTDNGTVNFAVAANLSSARTGTITVGGKTFTVNQAAAPLAAISVGNFTANEGDSGTTAFNFNVNLSAASNQTVSVNFETGNGTAVAGEDYNAASGTLTFAAGETVKPITVLVRGDSLIESNETFSVNLSNPANATLAAATGTGTILNDDAGGSIQFSLSGYTVNENAGTATITVNRTGGAASGVSVNYATSNGTALAGQDYTTASGTITFEAGATAKTFTVPIINDSVNEPNETINLTLSNSAGGAALGNPATAVLTIIDDDGAPTLSIDSKSVIEGNNGTTALTFTVSLLGTSSQTVTVNYSTVNGTAISPIDYQPISGLLSFASGVTTQTIIVLVNGDAEVEADETFTVNLSNAANATIANGQGVGTIRNDDIACSYSFTALTDFNASGSSGNIISVATQNGCDYKATTNDSFITIESGANGSGNGTVVFTIAANPGAARTGTIFIAGLPVTFNQKAASNPSARKVLFDFDGDGKSDITVFRPDNGVWYFLNSNAGFSAVQFGIATDKLAPADYDGDGKTDVAVWRDGNWYLQRSSAGFAAIQFGSPGDVPAPADFDGDGKAELVVWRPSNGVWYSLNLVNNDFSAVQFGSADDKPVTADYDGDGKADPAVYRPSSGTWYVLRSRDGFAAVQFGISTDKPVVGDYDGDGKADEAVYRPENGVWYVFGSTQGFTSVQFGIPTDLPAPGDYDGDGKTDIAVFRPASGNLYQMKTTQGFGSVQFGSNGDKPIANAFVR